MYTRRHLQRLSTMTTKIHDPMPLSNQERLAEQQAAQWQAQLSSDLATEQHQKEFAAWLAERPEHAVAWQKINAFWVGLDQVTAADLGIDLEPIETTQAISPLKRPRQQRLNRYYKPALGLAASLLLAIGLLSQPLGFYFADYTTATGQQRLLTLSDGSEITMNTNTALSVNVNGQQRHIHLVAGEAYFKVAPDPQRPFIVATELGETQALGTAFDVKVNEGDTDVAVHEHAVKITTQGGKVLDQLTAGQHAVYTGEMISPIEPINLQRGMAWRKQRMVFEDRPLAEVAAELERYRPGRILIMDDSIKNLRMTGVFGIEDTDIALRSIELSLPVKVSKFTNKLVVLSAK